MNKTKLLKQKKNFNSICHSCVSENPSENKAISTAGSSGSADAAPRMTECGRSTPICHCEKPKAQEVGGVFDFFKTHPTFPYALWEGQTGRSMVEMLGVLAVMGILSVAGIAVYNNAMNKYRANELLNEASKRAAAVAAQVSMQGKDADAVSIAEFTNPSGYTFGVAKKNANQFNITIDAVDTDICTQMKAASGTNTPIRKINDECTELTYNNDMSTTVWASDYETKSACETAGKTWCGGSDSCSEGECCADKTVGQCQECNAGAVLESAAEGETCDYSATGNDGVCHNGACVQKSTEANCVAGGVRCRDTTYGECCPAGYLCTTNGDTPGVCKKFTSGCTTNDDCTDTQYCKISGTCSDGIVSITSGTCTALGTPESVSIAGLGNVIVSPTGMNWWSAKNWCEAQQGKHLINVENFQAYLSGRTTQIVSNGTGGAGCAKGKKCGYWNNTPYSDMWTGNTLNETAGDTDGLYKDRFSPVVLALAKVFKGRKNYFWTASDYNNSSCGAFVVGVGNGYVDYLSRYYSGGYALCE